MATRKVDILEESSDNSLITSTGLSLGSTDLSTLQDATQLIIESSSGSNAPIEIISTVADPASSGANKVVITNPGGIVDSTLMAFESGLKFKGSFDIGPAQEYPDATGAEDGWWWMADGLGAGVTYTILAADPQGGDLTGTVVKDGDAFVRSETNSLWVFKSVDFDVTAFLMVDGSNYMTGPDPLNAGFLKVVNVANGSATGDVATWDQLELKADITTVNTDNGIQDTAIALNTAKETGADKLPLAGGTVTGHTTFEANILVEDRVVIAKASSLPTDSELSIIASGPKVYFQCTSNDHTTSKEITFSGYGGMDLTPEMLTVKRGGGYQNIATENYADDNFVGGAGDNTGNYTGDLDDLGFNRIVFVDADVATNIPLNASHGVCSHVVGKLSDVSVRTTQTYIETSTSRMWVRTTTLVEDTLTFSAWVQYGAMSFDDTTDTLSITL